MKPRTKTRLRPAVGLLVVAALAAACASSPGGGKDSAAGRSAAPTPSTYQVGMIGDDSGGEPVKGGTLTFGAYAEAAVLDPAQTIVAGSTGGLEMAAIYDVLMRWDTTSGEVRPQLAKGLEPSDGYKTWTLTLRDGVKFSDGTALDAEAVKWSLDRYVEKGADEARLWKDNVTSITTPDDSTVVFKLAKKWPTFPYMLTTGPGMIVARSSDEGGAFKPVGAGAFTFGSYAAHEETVLNAREDYWDGRPNLDKIRVIYMTDPNALLDSFTSGGAQAAFFRDPQLIDKALAAGFPGYMNMVALGNVGVINASEGRPGADPRVRQAMFQAIKPEVIYQRAYNGAGVAGTEVFPGFSRWHTAATSLPYDPDKARELLKQAKADGFDGKVTYLGRQDPSARATALAIKSMLESVGFQVELDLVRSVADQITKVSVNKDYDVAGWGISWREAGPYGRMFATLHSKGNLSVGMHTGPEMDALIDEFQVAETEDEQRAVMGRIQEQWNKDVPALVYGPTPEFLTWQKSVHGVEGTVNSMILLDDAWIASAG
ncbi:ABC transporter substrate-binding protein [Microtetraspora niveoalba]|uniref:ABC transporter substrate-binding protein n=1 Tax=Microtetraspora niveoalba TaxID=46175 RepID=UPI00082DE6C6|nr:ABC transporter substrate-binding protein [Microtetraspora niveoalba]